MTASAIAACATATVVCALDFAASASGFVADA